MELDTFLSSPRWDILRIIAERPSSPMEISEILGTTISFVSQQLKLLEAASIVKRTRTGNVLKGKPRTLFSILKETLYLVPLAKGFPEKKLVPLSRERRIVLRIWNLEDQKIQLMLERFFWKIEPFLDDIEGIYIYTKNVTPKLYFISKNSDLVQKINNTQKALEEKVPFQVTASVSAVSKLESEFLIPMYDPHRFFEGKINLKGGIGEDE